jgi:hypothetical protein
MFAIQIAAPQLARLIRAVGEARKSLPREISAAINATAKKTRLDIGRKIRAEIAVKKESVENLIKVVRQSSPLRLSAQVRLIKGKNADEEGWRIPLRDFGARQTKSGTSYKINKKGGRATVRSAFMVPSMGNHVFKRTTEKRLPIVKLMGPSPWGVFIKKKLTPVQQKEIEAELAKQIERRINLNVLRANKLVST